ncbi:hypothetical protein AHAS_Ahas02G0118400 [Arachis hypogaea]
MMRSLPDPSLPTFDPDIGRTISRIRQARHRLVLSEDESVTSFKEDTSSLSTDLVDLHAENMAAPRRITLQEAGAPDFTLPPFQARHPNLGADIELKTALINLLPKFHGLPAQEPLKHFEIFRQPILLSGVMVQLRFLFCCQPFRFLLREKRGSG